MQHTTNTTADSASSNTADRVQHTFVDKPVAADSVTNSHMSSVELKQDASTSNNLREVCESLPLLKEESNTAQEQDTLANLHQELPASFGSFRSHCTLKHHNLQTLDLYHHLHVKQPYVSG